MSSNAAKVITQLGDHRSAMTFLLDGCGTNIFEVNAACAALRGNTPSSITPDEAPADAPMDHESFYRAMRGDRPVYGAVEPIPDHVSYQYPTEGPKTTEVPVVPTGTDEELRRQGYVVHPMTGGGSIVRWRRNRRGPGNDAGLDD